MLPTGPDGFGEIRDTPEVLRNRQLVTTDMLPPPSRGEFEASISHVPDEVRARSTWSRECPVELSELRYLQMSFWGFDGEPHTGEMLVHARAAGDVVSVFRQLYQARFPIERMRVVAQDELDIPPTGDGNNTTAFVCRPSTGSDSWSQHAYGLAVDVNPFHNPYVTGDLVIPELASAYTDRGRDWPGMISSGGAATEAFRSIGWGWGGSWESAKDYMHFSSNGR